MLAAAVLFAVLCWRDRMSGITLLCLILPSYLLRFTIAGIPVTALEIFVLILFAIWLMRNGQWKRINVIFWRKSGVTNNIPIAYRFALSLLILAAGISAFLSPAQPEAFGILKAYFIEPLMLLIVLVYEIKTYEHFERIMSALGLLTMFIGCIAIYQHFTGVGIENPFWADAAHRRVTTLFGYPNANSLLVAPIVAYYIGSFTRQQTMRKQWYSLIVIILGIATVLAAKTTGAALALLVIGWLTLFRIGRLRLLLGLATTIGIIIFLTMTPVTEKFSSLVRNVSRNYLDLKSSSLEIRINQWRETAELLMAHPFRGGGLANYQNAVRPFHTHEFLEIYLYPHTILLNTWSELGLLGLIAFIWLLVAIGNTLQKALNAHFISGNSRALAWGMTMAWICIVIHGLVDVPYFKNDLSILWMIFVAGTIYLANTTVKLNRGHKKSW